MKKRKLADLLRSSQAPKPDNSTKDVSSKHPNKAPKESQRVASKASGHLLAPFFEFSSLDSGTTGANQPQNLVPFPYSFNDRILLLGEGNFSHASDLADYYFELANSCHETAEKLPENEAVIKKLPSHFLMATCLEPNLQSLLTKYPECHPYVQNIEARGGQILYNLDATKLHIDKRVLKYTFNRIVFHFPHLGAGMKDQRINLGKHQQFMRDVLSSCCFYFDKVYHDRTFEGAEYKIKMLAVESLDTLIPKFYKITSGRPEQHLDDDSDDLDDDGSIIFRGKTLKEFTPEVHITLKQGEPYDSWEIRKIPRTLGLPRLAFRESFAFIKERLPNYLHVNTIGHLDSTKIKLQSQDAPDLPNHLQGHTAKTSVFAYTGKTLFS